MFADVSWDWADVTDAWSDWIWLVDAPSASSLDSLAWAAVRLAWAESAVAWSADGSIVGERLPGRHGLPGGHVDRGDFAGGRKVEVGLLGRG